MVSVDVGCWLGVLFGSLVRWGVEIGEGLVLMMMVRLRYVGGVVMYWWFGRDGWL